MRTKKKHGFFARVIATILALVLILGNESMIAGNVVQAAASSSSTSATTRISVHDPSIFYDSSSNSYYIYGSHLAQAKSNDLRNWAAVETQGYTNKSIYVSENVEGIYYIQNKFSGLYLDVADGSTENGANIRQWEYNGSQAQMFKFVSTGDGYYYILTGASDYSKCVDVDSGSSADGTNIMQWEYWGGDMQKYRVVQQADGTYAILTNASGCTSGLDVYEWSTENGGNINQWNFWGGDCQKWNLIEAEKNSGSTKASTGEPLETALASSFLWAGYNDSDCSGGYAVWAPDIIYNPDYVWNDGSKGAYMMYYSASSTYIRSCIGFAVSKSVDGPFSYVDTVVYSGFTNGDNEVTTTSSLGTKTVNTNYTNTNIPSLIASGELSAVRSGWFNSDGSFNNTLFPNAIDPTLVYDASGNLWMTYGSWSGGIFILQIDEATGLPIYPKSNSGQTDGYFGTRIAGGYGKSGEAPYIVYDSSNGYYYLYVTYGWLGSDGGYHIRVYRSKTINGTYTDASGSSAIFSSSSNQSKLGVKLFGNYDFSTLSTVGYKSGGHNSAFIDTDGQRYLVYHTRFDDGYEYHEVRVHQQFMNQDNWPVTAVYEYLGSTISQTGYSMDSMCGTYEFVNHGLNADTANVGMLSTKKVTLNSDGTISGDYSGTWSYTSGTYYCQMKIDGVTYKGVFFKQKDEASSHKEVMTFTLIGSDNRSIWGTKTSADTSATAKPSATATPTAKPNATQAPGSSSGSGGTRQMEALSRGLVAVKTNSGVFLSWRLLGTEDYSIKFNVYRDGVKIASNISDSTNYLDTNGSIRSSYMVRAVVNGSEVNQSDTVTPWTNNYKDVPISKPSGNYSANDATVADVDGDGEYEIILKWDPSDSKDNSQSGYTSNVYVDCYEMNGTRKWRIDLGKNIRAGAHYTQFIAYDLNGDGKAEVAMKTADGTVDGKGNIIGDASKDYRNSSGYVLDGPEYLTLFEGSSGKELVTIDYYPARGTVSSWGDNYGNRVDRFLAGVAYFDGKTPSLVVCRGYYTRSVIVSYEYKGGKLNQEWVFDTNTSGNSAYAGQGNHNLSIADVDNDGKDEVVYGSAVIDNDGTGLYSTGDGHGDALHVGDFDPTHSGLEIFQVHETKTSDIESIQFRDAKSGKTIWSKSLSKDIGRGLILNIDPEFYPYVTLASSGNYYTADGKAVTSSVSGLGINFATYWDGDLYREGLDGTTINKWDYHNNKVVTALSGSNVHSNNGTKATPSLSGDILGDWREEVIWPTSDDTALRIYTTTDVTSEKLYTLMHDSQYRLAIAWQNVGYNQPPHTSYYMGPDMATPSQPSLYTVGSYTLPSVSGTVVTPTAAPTAKPTTAPTAKPTTAPTATAAPTEKPTTAPVATETPTSAPTQAPSGDVTATSYTHNFTTAGKTSDFFSITGNLSTSKGSVSYNGLSLTQCLKLESSTKVSFTVASDAELTLVFNSANSSNVKVDGTKYTLNNGILTMNVAAGTHTITKANTANLFYIAVAVKGSGSGAAITPTAAPTQAPTAAPTAKPTETPTATAVPTATPTAIPTAAPTTAPNTSGVAYTGSVTITGANWWAAKDISKSDLLGSVDASTVTSIKFSADTDFFVGYNSTNGYKQPSGQKKYTLTDVTLNDYYYLQVAMSKNDNVAYKITWEVYTGTDTAN